VPEISSISQKQEYLLRMLKEGVISIRKWSKHPALITVRQPRTPPRIILWKPLTLAWEVDPEIMAVMEMGETLA
jgi:hypothetical protein